MRAKASVVIVGAGIVGCAAAYHLTRLGWRDVVVLEQGPLFKAGGSSSHAPGIVFQTNPSKTMCLFAQETVALYDSLRLNGEPVWYGVGSLEVAQTAARLDDLKRRHGWATSWGLDSKLVTPEEAVALVPALNPGAILGAYYVPSDGVAKPVAASEALAQAAIEAGTEFHERTAVTGFERENGRVTAVLTSAGRIATDRVLLCAGIWGPKVGKLAGVPVPLTPCEHQLVWTKPVPEFAGETREIAQPVIRAQDKDLYFRQRRDGYCYGSYAHEPHLVDTEAIRPHEQAGDMPASNPFTPDDMTGPRQDAIELVPLLADAETAEAFNGMFSFTPDSYPLMGESAALKGFWLAEAVWITHAGGVAKAVAEWMTRGRAELDLRECDVNRFEPHAFTKAYITTRGAQQYREVYDIIHPLEPMTEPRPLRVSPFYEREAEQGAVFFEGTGWERPRWYETNARLLRDIPAPDRDAWAGRFWSPIAAAEHITARSTAGLFDMTPLPKLEVAGPGALDFLQRMTSNQIDKPVGAVTYTLMLDERGTIRSDVTVIRAATDRFQLGANGPLDLDWLRRHAPADGSAQVRDITGQHCCLGLWGPNARAVLSSVSDGDLSNAAFPYFSAREIGVGEAPVLAVRVSYVGELGWELYAPVEYGGRLWDLLWKAGASHGLIPVGRAAFESMRLEKGYRLWGADMHTEYDPFEAGVGFAVKLDKGDFLGREGLIARKTAGPTQKLCCLTLDDPCSVVMGKEPVRHGDEVVSYVTSAAYGFSVGRGIAYSYLPVALAKSGTALTIEYFGRRLPATVAIDPLFDPKGARLRG
jgi:glycine cleavage system aminomethyltransferase T/glycine/D-amino acid oxidase-like deaminating enzyme